MPTAVCRSAWHVIRSIAAVMSTGEATHADAVTVRDATSAKVAAPEHALLDAEKYVDKARAAVPTKPAPEPTGTPAMPVLPIVNPSYPSGFDHNSSRCTNCSSAASISSL